MKVFWSRWGEAVIYILCVLGWIFAAILFAVYCVPVSLLRPAIPWLAMMAAGVVHDVRFRMKLMKVDRELYRKFMGRAIRGIPDKTRLCEIQQKYRDVPFLRTIYVRSIFLTGFAILLFFSMPFFAFVLYIAAGGA